MKASFYSFSRHSTTYFFSALCRTTSFFSTAFKKKFSILPHSTRLLLASCTYYMKYSYSNRISCPFFVPFSIKCSTS